MSGTAEANCLLEEARTLIDAARQRDLVLRLVGVTFPVAESDEPSAMGVRVFRFVLAGDWGWCKTITLNLDRYEEPEETPHD